MISAALTGGIATGKTFCLGRFAALGVPVIDADVLAREAVTRGTAGLSAVVARFGPGVLHGDGSLDRAALGRIVFRDRSARADLEAIIHPEVYRRIQTWFANLSGTAGLGIADIPLLYETGHQHEFDCVIVCACDPEEQLRRLMRRDALTQEDARARLATQWPIEEKAQRADFVIRTDGSHGETDAQVRAVFRALNAGRRKYEA
jgi:dephospho-CoA kinase